MQEVNLIDLSDEEGRRALHREEGEPETDEERLEKLKKIRDTLRQVTGFNDCIHNCEPAEPPGEPSAGPGRRHGGH